MNTSRTAYTACLSALFLAAAAACSSRVPPSVVSWRADAPVVAPAKSPPDGSGDGVLVVATDRDQTQTGSNYYYGVRRPYEIYGAEGQLVARIQNQGLRQGEEPESVSLPPGRYVVASMYGTVYRRVQVEIRPGAKTEVSEDTLGRAAAVFAKTGS
jgi:hypothetical protein